MKVEHDGRTVRIELTRRNLRALLDKLDDSQSMRTLIKNNDTGSCQVWITAVEDIEHYADRAPGLMYKPSAREFH